MTNPVQRMIGAAILATLAVLTWNRSPRLLQMPALVPALLLGAGAWLMTDGFSTRTDRVIGGLIAGAVVVWVVYG